MGNPEGRFTLTLYADLECPFCREYFPQLKRWVGNNTDVALQWHHQPLAAHEPAASAEARLAECAAEAGGRPLPALGVGVERDADSVRCDVVGDVKTQHLEPLDGPRGQGPVRPR